MSWFIPVLSCVCIACTETSCYNQNTLRDLCTIPWAFSNDRSWPYSLLPLPDITSIGLVIGIYVCLPCLTLASPAHRWHKAWQEIMEQFLCPTKGIAPCHDYYAEPVWYNPQKVVMRHLCAALSHPHSFVPVKMVPPHVTQHMSCIISVPGIFHVATIS